MKRLEERQSVSTWSLHRTLGNFVADDSAVDGGPMMSLPEISGGMTLLELIPEIAKRGYASLQICHFHLTSRDMEYLQQVRQAIADNGLSLEMFLIDDGDLTSDDGDRQMAWYDGWLDVAEQLGARRARLCVGRHAPTPALLDRSGKRLAELAAAHPNVRIVTENWLEATPDAESLLAALDSAGDAVGLLIDLANWQAPEKYLELAKIAPRAESCHAKCHFSADGPDVADFEQTLTILKDAGFDGPFALIYDGPDPDEWAGLDAEWKIVERIANSE